MDDNLPVQPTQGSAQNVKSDAGVNAPPAQPTPLSGSIGKELEGGAGLTVAESPRAAEIGHDVDLPKEVSRVGVTVHPTVIPIPANLTRAGVRPAGMNVPASTGGATTVVLPLTDAEIAAGLTKSITLSWRWLAEWCRRRIKQIHTTLVSKKK